MDLGSGQEGLWRTVIFRHGRAWPGHPRFFRTDHRRTWRPGMKKTRRNRRVGKSAICAVPTISFLLILETSSRYAKSRQNVQVVPLDWLDLRPFARAKRSIDGHSQTLPEFVD